MTKKRGVGAPKKKGAFRPADRRFEPNPALTASTGGEDLPHKTHNYTLSLLQASGISGEWSPKERNLAIRFSRHLIERIPLGTMKIPQHIKNAVWEAMQEACSETGFKLPKPEKKTTRNKKR